jgi:hypothetical protein
MFDVPGENTEQLVVIDVSCDANDPADRSVAMIDLNQRTDSLGARLIGKRRYPKTGQDVFDG